MTSTLYVKNYRKASSVKKFIPAGILSAFSLSIVMPIAVLAWNANASAKSLCETENNEGAVIEVSFTNNENSNAINVIAQDLQTGATDNLGTVKAHNSARGEIIPTPHRASLNSGTVRFSMTWANGQKGTDHRDASYAAIKCEQPTPTPTPTNKPTETPTPTKRPSATPTVTPTITPSAIPTEMPSVTPTEMPTATPTVTPTEMPFVTATPSPVPPTPNNNTNVNSNSNDNHTDVHVDVNNTNNNNIDITNNQTQTGTVQAAVVQAPAQASQLPKTGTPFEAYGIVSLLPLGWKLRKFARLS